MIRLAAVVLFASTSVMSAAATPNPPSSVAVAPKAYVVIEIAVTDRADYENYKKAIEPIILAHGGRYIARAGRTETIDPPAPAGRVVLLEFPSFDSALAFENAPETHAASEIRHRSSKSRIYVVEGIVP